MSQVENRLTHCCRNGLRAIAVQLGQAGKESVDIDIERRPGRVGGVEDGEIVGVDLLSNEKLTWGHSDGKAEPRDFDDIALQRKKILFVVNRVV